MNKTLNFIEKAKLIHNYDYSKSEYINTHSPVIIICKIHGEFKQRPYAHLNGQGCPKCGLINRKHPGQKSHETFLKQANAKWGQYKYISNYINKTTKIKYICPKHGEIEQLPALHLRSGCYFCNGRGISRHSRASFIEIANKVHNSHYNYDKTDFTRMTDIITITCPIHGDFNQRAGHHIHLKNGCPSCSHLLRTSSEEINIYNFIKSNYNYTIEQNNRTILDGKEIDIYLPDVKFGVEYHGIYWHLETIRGKKYHFNKWKECNEKGIKLIQIYENEWLDKQEIIKSKLLHYLGKSNKIHARHTKVIEMNRHEKDEFLDKNHLQGSDSSKIYYGLKYNNEFVSCMTFGPSRFNKKYKWELLRFSNKCGLSVVGGASKLLNKFRKKYEGSIISYADKRYSDGNLYKAIGFELDGETKPSFSYVKISNSQIFNRMNFQKKSLKNMNGYSDDLTEYEIMQLNGYDRIWDAGQYRFAINNIHN